VQPDSDILCSIFANIYPACFSVSALNMRNYGSSGCWGDRQRLAAAAPTGAGNRGGNSRVKG